MRVRLLSRMRPIAGLIVALLFLSAIPHSRAATSLQAVRPAGIATVTGRVLANSMPVLDTYVLVAPQDAQGNVDYNNARVTFTDNQTGTFTLGGLDVGTYLLDIKPYCVSDALPYTRTFAILSPSASVNLGDIVLPGAPKHIQGTVMQSGSPVAGAPIEAYNTDTWSYACAKTENSGQFSIGVEGGEWEVAVEPVPGATWMFTQTAPLVRFANNPASETKNLALTVQPTNAYLTGQVFTPDGAGLLPPTYPYGSTNYSAYVRVWSAENNSYTYGYLSATGTFSIPVVAGQYNVSVGLYQSDYPDYARPPDIVANVAPGTLDLGNIALLRRDSGIAGSVTATGAGGIANAYVQAYGSDGGFDYARTDQNGNYQLRVSAGDWHVDVFPPDGSNYLDHGASQSVVTTKNVTTTLSFELTPAAAQIDGILQDQSGNVLTGVDAWAYVHAAGSSDLIDEVPVRGGAFSLNVPSGLMQVGVFLPPGSDYSLTSEVTATTALARALAANQSLSGAAMAQLEQAPYERTVAVPDARATQSIPLKSVTIQLAHNDAHIHGTLRDQNGKPVTDIDGVVVAAPSNPSATWQWANLRPDGTYDLPVAAGAWYLRYYLNTDRYTSSPPDRKLVQATANQIVTQDLTTVSLDGMIEGLVQDENGAGLASAYVWVRGTNFEDYVLTDSSGHFKIDTPLYDGSNYARFTIGTALPCDEAALCILNADALMVTAAPRTAQIARLIAPQFQTNILTVTRSGTNVNVRGSILLDGGAPASGADVNFDPAVGESDWVTTDSQGKYNAQIRVARGTTRMGYKLSVTYVDSQGRCYCPRQPIPGTLVNIPAALRSMTARGVAPADIEGPAVQLSITAQLPHSLSAVFNVADGATYTLSDGTQIQILANAVPVSQGETQVRITIEPTARVTPTDLYRGATYYGYSINLFEGESGNQITQQLNADALITLRYTQSDLAQHGAAESQIRAASFSDDLWQPAASYVPSPEQNKVTVLTRTLGTWALVQSQGSSQLNLPLVRR
ncbi:MAG TPA: hypothetical protein VF909_05360 [Roseiflexaceae bacterium]